ncbi:PREDICTED: transcription initiation factor TFIID subunit 5-like isoform X2 [Tarenaya hassleriana]|uniref:transcription initiation factor TFIID subunit 5-like isoform X2 n=1 Tax=Tarenaya hassleriana TaxID=28532 RepID=UPI00053C53E1|nr:PREDICTED: transcription initiation factor TFIID subunit 5-like isoform X2 [Tarenaya hassleriana]
MGIYDSLDLLYKHELHCVCSLIHRSMGKMTYSRGAFFNSFREDNDMRWRELQKLEGVHSPSHLEEMDFARSLRQSKVNIKICQYSYDLLLQNPA